MIFKKKKEEPKNVDEILKGFKELEEKVGKLSEGLENLKKESRLHIQKVGIVRYNPFSNVGGDQSFSIALLNSNNDGLVVTGLYAEGGSRVYSKPIKNGGSPYTLSKEEVQAIQKAV
jgi:hypothetical protein